MFTFIFKGKLYQAKTVKELSLMLKEAGYTEDVEAMYAQTFIDQEDVITAEDILESEDEQANKDSIEAEQTEQENYNAAVEAIQEEERIQDQAAIDLGLQPDPKKMD